MPMATTLALSSGLLLMLLAITLGGSLSAFLDLPSLLIVLGGTFSVTLVCHSLEDVRRATREALRVLQGRLPEPSEAAREMLRLAEQARRDGILSLQEGLARLAGTPLLQKALALAVDGLSGSEIERILSGEIHATAERQQRYAAVFRRAAEAAPAMGLIGTLVGLVQMLGNLEDPGAIGPGMAVALLTTFYGAVLANMVFAPLANKLENSVEQEVLRSNVYLLGASSIVRQENPRWLEVQLNGLLPPAQRLKHFD